MRRNWLFYPALAFMPLAAIFFSFRIELGEFFLGKEASLRPMELVNLPAMHVVYRDLKGSYQQSAKWTSDFIEAAEVNHIPCRELWSEFLDIMVTIKEGEQRARIGCVVEAVPSSLADGQRGKATPAGTYVRMKMETLNPMALHKAGFAMFAYGHANGVFMAGPLMMIHDRRSEQIGQFTLLMPVRKAAE